MKKIIFFIFMTISFAQVTNEQILKKLDNIQIQVNSIQKEVQNLKHNQELLKQEMNLRFEAIDKRFEAIDKRFEMMNENFNKRFDQIDKRFETLTNLLMSLIAGIFGLIGFMMWDRRTVAQKIKEECDQEIKIQTKIIEAKADKEYVDRFVKAMNELLVLKDDTAINIFKKYNLL